MKIEPVFPFLIQILSWILDRCQWDHIFWVYNTLCFNRSRCKFNGQKCKFQSTKYDLKEIFFLFFLIIRIIIQNFPICQFFYLKWTQSPLDDDMFSIKCDYVVASGVSSMFISSKMGSEVSYKVCVNLSIFRIKIWFQTCSLQSYQSLCTQPNGTIGR